MCIKKVLAFTGIRSDYDLMSGLYKKINEHTSMELALIVSGAHLSETYGCTYRSIEADGLPILAKIESLLDSNSLSSRLKSASICLQNCIHTVESYNPDVIIYPGDREDVIVGSLIGAYLGITTIHFFGGDHATDGNVDNAIRHATSKLSSLHFVSNKEHKDRLLRIGEPSERIFVIGSPALDKFINTPIIPRQNLLKKLGKSKWNNYVIVIYHPISGSTEDESGIYFEEILKTLKLNNLNAFVSYPNSDSGSKQIIQVIEKYSKDSAFKFYKNLNRIDFINLARYAMFMIGNSSAGIVEAPMIPLAAINVGLRQRGRLSTDNVVFVDHGIENIQNGIETVISDGFQHTLKSVASPYGDGKSVDQALKLLNTLDFKKFRLKHEDPLVVT